MKMSGKKKKNQSSNYKGVSYNNKNILNKNWSACIYTQPNSRKIGLGSTYNLQCDAALAYDKATIQLRGRDAMRNFPTLTDFQNAKKIELETTGLSVNVGMTPATIEAKVNEMLRKAGITLIAAAAASGTPDRVSTFQQVKDRIKNYPGGFDQIPNSDQLFSGLSCTYEGDNMNWIRNVKQLDQNMQHYKTTPIRHKNCKTAQEKAENKAATQIGNWKERRSNWEDTKEFMILNALGYISDRKWKPREDDAVKTYAVNNYGLKGVNWGQLTSVEALEHRTSNAIIMRYVHLMKEIPDNIPFVLRCHFLRLSTGDMIHPLLSLHAADDEEEEEEVEEEEEGPGPGPGPGHGPYDQSTVPAPSIIQSGRVNEYDASTMPMGDADTDAPHPDDTYVDMGLAGHGGDNHQKDGSNTQNESQSKDDKQRQDIREMVVTAQNELNANVGDNDDYTLNIPPAQNVSMNQGETLAEHFGKVIVNMMDKSNSSDPVVAELRLHGESFLKNVLTTAQFPRERDSDLFKMVLERTFRKIDFETISSKLEGTTPQNCKKRWRAGCRSWKKVNDDKTKLETETKEMARKMTEAMDLVIDEHITSRDNVPTTITVELLKTMVEV